MLHPTFSVATELFQGRGLYTLNTARPVTKRELKSGLVCIVQVIASNLLSLASRAANKLLITQTVITEGGRKRNTLTTYTEQVRAGV